MPQPKSNEDLAKEIVESHYNEDMDMNKYPSAHKLLTKIEEALAQKDAEVTEALSGAISDLEQCKFQDIVEGDTYTPQEINSMFNSAIKMVEVSFEGIVTPKE